MPLEIIIVGSYIIYICAVYLQGFVWIFRVCFSDRFVYVYALCQPFDHFIVVVFFSLSTVSGNLLGRVKKIIIK